MKQKKPTGGGGGIPRSDKASTGSDAELFGLPGKIAAAREKQRKLLAERAAGGADGPARVVSAAEAGPKHAASGNRDDQPLGSFKERADDFDDAERAVASARRRTVSSRRGDRWAEHATPPRVSPRRAATSPRLSTALLLAIPLGVVTVGGILAVIAAMPQSEMNERVAAVAVSEPVASPPAPIFDAARSAPELARPALRAASGESSLTTLLEGDDPDLEEPVPPSAANESPASDPGSAPFEAAETAAAALPRADARQEPTIQEIAEVSVADEAETIRPETADAGVDQADDATTQVETDTPTIAAADTSDVSEETPVAQAPSAAVVGSPEVSRVLVYFPTGADEDASRLERALSRAGFTGINLLPTSFPISQTNVRYFSPDDQALGRAVGDLASGEAYDGSVEVRDFTEFRPRPSSGTIEVWLAGGILPPS